VSNKFREVPKAEPVHENLESVEKENSTKDTPPPKKRKKGVLAKALSSVFSGTFLTNERTLKHVPYLLFLACIAILYIANNYHADDTIRESNTITNQLKELKSELISTKSDLMFLSKQSEVAKSVESMGLKEPIAPPMKIEVDSLKPKANISGE